MTSLSIKMGCLCTTKTHRKAQNQNHYTCFLVMQLRKPTFFLRRNLKLENMRNRGAKGPSIKGNV